MKEKTTNQRTCIGCRRKADRSEFIRIVAGQDQLQIDPAGHAEGRGAYLCPQDECFQKAIKKRAFNYRLKKKLTSKEIDEFKAKFDQAIK